MSLYSDTNEQINLEKKTSETWHTFQNQFTLRQRLKMEVTPKNQHTAPGDDTHIRNKYRKLSGSFTPDENPKKTFFKLNIKTVEQQCDVKVSI